MNDTVPMKDYVDARIKEVQASLAAADARYAERYVNQGEYNKTHNELARKTEKVDSLAERVGKLERWVWLGTLLIPLAWAIFKWWRP